MLPLSAGNTSADATGKRRLLRTFNALSDADKQTLLAFAEFLAQREQTSPPAEAQPDQAVPPPRNIPRPDKESVVAAMRRLSQNYAMLNKDELLHQASGLMGEHILQGKSAALVIDELEALFADAYAKQVSQSTAESTAG